MTDENLNPGTEESGDPTEAEQAAGGTGESPAADGAASGDAGSDAMTADASGVEEAVAEPAHPDASPADAGVEEPFAAAASSAPADAASSTETAPAAEAAPAPEPAPAPPARVKAPPPRVKSIEEEFGQEPNEENYRAFSALNEGDVVSGVVVHIDKGEVLVDVGTKSEGIIRRNELSRDTSIPAEDIVKVGDRIDVYVMEAENQDGNLILSKKRADFEKAWEKVQEAKEEGRTLTAMVTDRVKGGLVVDLGIRGFVPASHVGNGSMKNNLERYVGQSIPLKVIEVDKERRKVVLSNKLAVDEDRLSKKAETVSSLQVGQIRRGIVRRLTNYGAFVDLGGIDGLLHISEMSWTRINHPQEVLKEGQEIDVVVLKMDLEAGRVSLGLRQILPDPWTEVDKRYHAGDVITGQVSRVVPFGVFVQLDGGIEGIIPNSELSGRKGGKATTLTQGQEVEVKVVDVRPDERKMTLSLRSAKQDEEAAQERKEIDDFQESRSTAAAAGGGEQRFTIGDALRAKEENDEPEDLGGEEDRGSRSPAPRSSSRRPAPEIEDDGDDTDDLDDVDDVDEADEEESSPDAE